MPQENQRRGEVEHAEKVLGVTFISSSWFRNQRIEGCTVGQLDHLDGAFLRDAVLAHDAAIDDGVPS